MMGDCVPRPASGLLDMTARVVHGDGLRLEFLGAEGRLTQVDISGDNQSVAVAVPVGATPYVRAQLVETTGETAALHALTNPIYITQTEVPE